MGDWLLVVLILYLRTYVQVQSRVANFGTVQYVDNAGQLYMWLYTVLDMYSMHWKIMYQYD